jgi:iron complex outermembrane receptor protein
MHSSHLQSISIIFFIFIYFFDANVLAQKDTILLNETEVLSTHIPGLYTETSRIIQIITKTEIEKAPVQSLQELLEYALNVDVRQRGGYGVQADVSIRGGSFEQCLILLNGVKMNDPQTGHHNLNLPIDLQDIDRIEILEGPAARVYGTNAFTGAINIITASKKENRLKLTSIIGENQLYASNASLSLANRKMLHYFSVGKKASDGYINNTDFDIANLFYQNNLQLKNGSIGLQTGYNIKQFGANSFYSAKYPNQFEETKVFFANATYKNLYLYNLTTNIYYRRHQDRFELFRDNPPSWYKTHNYHLTQTYGAEAKLNFNSCIGKTAFGAEFRSENILSNVLGESMSETIDVPGEALGVFTKTHHRENIGLYGEQSYSYRHFNISGGMFLNWNSDFDSKVNAGVDVSYDITGSWKWFASINQSMRMPTFTDLYYVGPSNKGNINLKPEEAVSYETGIKFNSKAVNAHIDVFRRDGNNLIDWVRLPDSTKWESRNLTNIITNGFDFSVKISMERMIYQRFIIKNINLSYSFLDMEKNSENFISYYALDYLKHKFTASLEHRIYKRLKADWAMCYQERMGTYTNITNNKETTYPKYITVDSRLTYMGDNWSCFLEAANVFDKKYQDIGNIQMPGRWFRAGVNISLSLEKKMEKRGNDVIEIIN